MQHIVDLELWSRPRQNAEAQDGKAVAFECRTATALADEVVLGLNFVPGRTDVENLRRALLNSEASFVEFKQYCAAHLLQPEVGAERSAARFLAFIWGQQLAWLHFPANLKGRQMAQLVLHWAEGKGLSVVRGQGEPALREVELASLWAR